MYGVYVSGDVNCRGAVFDLLCNKLSSDTLMYGIVNWPVAS